MTGRGLWLPPAAGSIVVPDEGRDYVERRRFDELRALRGGRLPIMGAAELFPDEGLDFLIGVAPRKTNTFPDPAFLFLFTSQTASTVPARGAVLATATGVTEVSGGGYARASIAASNWPAPATSGSGRRSTVADPGISFAESTGAFSNPVNGFGLATASTAGVAIFYANFDQLAAVTVNAAGYTIRVPPFVHFDG